MFVITWTTRDACIGFGNEHENSKQDMFLKHVWLLSVLLIKVIGV